MNPRGRAGDRLSLLLALGCDMRSWKKWAFRVVVTAGVGGLGGAGIVVFGAGMVVAVAVVLLVVAPVWVAVFAASDAPSQRIVRLIKAVRRR